MAIDTHNIVRHTELVDILREEITGVLANDGLAEHLPATMIWGAPGVGKSTMVKSLAKEMGVDVTNQKSQKVVRLEKKLKKAN